MRLCRIVVSTSKIRVKLHSVGCKNTRKKREDKINNTLRVSAPLRLCVKLENKNAKAQRMKKPFRHLLKTTDSVRIRRF